MSFFLIYNPFSKHSNSIKIYDFNKCSRKFQSFKHIKIYSLFQQIYHEVSDTLKAQPAGPNQHEELVLAAGFVLHKVERVAGASYHRYSVVVDEPTDARHRCYKIIERGREKRNER